MLVDRLSPSTPPASTPISELEELFSATRSTVYRALAPRTKTA